MLEDDVELEDGLEVDRDRVVERRVDRLGLLDDGEREASSATGGKVVTTGCCVWQLAAKKTAPRGARRTKTDFIDYFSSGGFRGKRRM